MGCCFHRKHTFLHERLCSQTQEKDIIAVIIVVQSTEKKNAKNYKT